MKNVFVINAHQEYEFSKGELNRALTEMAVEHLKAKGYEIPAGHYEVFRPESDVPGADGRGPTFAPALYRAEDSNTAFLTDEAIKYISVRRDRPWFVHLSYLAPHPPFVVPEPYHALYDPADVPLPVRAESPEAEAAQHRVARPHVVDASLGGVEGAEPHGRAARAL